MMPPPRRHRPRRSLLYVPGDRKEMLTKAASRGADGLILNLEDAVAPARKDLAREAVAEALRGLDFGTAEVIVRINVIGSDDGYRDLRAVGSLGLHAICLPKVSAVEEVRFASSTLAHLERNAGLAPGQVGLMCMIESAAGLLAAAEIARCDARIVALLFGAADFSADVGCQPVPDNPTLLHARSHVVIAAKAAGLSAVDAPYMQLHDEEGLVRCANAARALGFDGMSAIHPTQVPAINAAFLPTAEQITWAQRVMALVPSGDATRLGAAILDGQLIEAPHLARAQRILAMVRPGNG